MSTRTAILLVLMVTACARGDRQSGTPCGIAALAGPTLLLSEFSVPNQTLGLPPSQLPERLVARIAAGPAFSAVVGRADTTWVIGVEGYSEPEPPGFGVLVLDEEGAARGVLLYPGEPITGAPRIGDVSVEAEMLPLIGIRLAPARYEDPACPLFPDSLLL